MHARVVACGILLLACVAAAQTPAARPSAASEAGKLYASAMSQYQASQYEQAKGLLEKYLAAYSSHEYAPVAWMQLAYCRLALKDAAGCDAALDEVINRFGLSPAWFIAYGSKLSRAKAAKESDKYLTTLEAMLRQSQEAPLRLHGAISWQYGDYNAQEYAYVGRDYEPLAGRLGAVVAPAGWVMDATEMADTPDRAGRALKVLAPTFQLRAGRKDLPPDWQFAHVALLRQAGKAQEAQAAFDAYAGEWAPAADAGGDALRDPRGMTFWLLQLKDAQTRKDPQGVEQAWEALLKNYAGSGSLEDPLWERLAGLAAQDRYDEFVSLARRFLREYGTSRWRWYVVGAWVELARAKVAKGDTSRIAGVMDMLNQAYRGNTLRRRAYLATWIDLLNLLKRSEDAARMAEELMAVQNWSADSFTRLTQYAAGDKAFARVVEAARTIYSIPVAKDDSPALPLLKQLKERLKDDQVRHAEEVGEELFTKHRTDAHTMEAVKALCDYFFAKVLAEPRDRWMDRMIQAYPRHPLTQAVLQNRIVSLGATREYDKQAEAIDLAAARFPGAAGDWYTTRLYCYDVANDPNGKLEFIHRYYGAAAEAGDFDALYEIGRWQGAGLGTDNKAIGDMWLVMGRPFAAPAAGAASETAPATALATRPATAPAATIMGGARIEQYCLVQAWANYYMNPWYGYWTRDKVKWDEGAAVMERLRTSQFDPELRWKLAFADVNLLAHRGKAAEALRLLDERLKDGQTIRDLSLRLDLAGLGSALGQAALVKEAEALAARLGKMCPTERDEVAIELMLAAANAVGSNHAAVAESYGKIVESARWPARMRVYFGAQMTALRSAGSPKYGQEFDRYLRKVNTCQEIVPGLMLELGTYYVQTRNPAAVQVRERLVNRFAASSARDKMDELLGKAK